MSKDFEGKGFTNDLSTLEVQPKSVETFGILCELSNTCKYFTNWIYWKKMHLFTKYIKEKFLN